MNFVYLGKSANICGVAHIFAFKICLPHQSVMPFLSGAAPPKKNPGSAPVVNVFFVTIITSINFESLLPSLK